MTKMIIAFSTSFLIYFFGISNFSVIRPFVASKENITIDLKTNVCRGLNNDLFNWKIEGDHCQMENVDLKNTFGNKWVVIDNDSGATLQLEKSDIKTKVTNF